MSETVPLPRSQLAPVTGEVLRRARGGEIDAREAVARRALTLALRTARAVTASMDEGDDIAQEVGAAVMRQLRAAPPAPAFDYWVHRITVRTALRTITRTRLRRQREVALSDAGWDEIPDNAAPMPGRPAPELVASMLQLQPRERLAVVLRYVHDLSEAEVADALDCRPGTAAATLSRARARLRASLVAQGVQIGDLLEAAR